MTSLHFFPSVRKEINQFRDIDVIIEIAPQRLAGQLAAVNQALQIGVVLVLARFLLRHAAVGIGEGQIDFVESAVGIQTAQVLGEDLPVPHGAGQVQDAGREVVDVELEAEPGDACRRGHQPDPGTAGARAGAV